MKKTVALLIIAAVGALAIAAVAGAASAGLRVIGTSRSSGDFAVTAASGSAKARALYIRGYGRSLSGHGVVACSRGIASIGSKSTSLNRMTSGRLYRLRMPFSGNCQVTAGLSGNGPIRLQILAG